LPYRIVFSPEAQSNLRGLTARNRAIVLDDVEQQLSHQPTVETRNRKPLRPNELAKWSLRIGDLRVYYEVDDEPVSVVHVRAVGVKQGNQVFIDNQEVKP